ncbi:hypothetical protein FVE85_0068 [Porphyridium purpureum]|uniref:Uncharacterized protein n=1 Tax=Porphyridium purpureum TaxID=35688 RepID=A0A5J4YXM3_PORPP|nr:hypothetical protein FVE85_0068 [Porphyridium purpureum]|eukprot:POR0928..scf208_2
MKAFGRASKASNNPQLTVDVGSDADRMDSASRPSVGVDSALASAQVTQGQTSQQQKKGIGKLFRKVRLQSGDAIDAIAGLARSSRESTGDSRPLMGRMSVGGGAEPSDGVAMVSRASYCLDDLPNDVDGRKFKEILNGAKNGTVSVVALLEAMFLLEENLAGETYVALFKYLSRQENLKVMVKLLTAPPFGSRPRRSDVSGNVMRDDIRYEERSAYVSSVVLSSGPYQVRRALSLSPQLVELLFKYFETDGELDPVGTVRVSRVIFALMNDNPHETVKVMQKRRTFVQTLVLKLHSVPVAELLPQIFSTSQPDSLSTLKFGPPNIEGMPFLLDSRVMEIVADTFIGVAQQTHAQPPAGSAVASEHEQYMQVSLLENAPRCLSAITMRAMTTSPFGRDNCNFDRVVIRKLNQAIDELNFFVKPRPLMRMLDAALEAAQADPLRRALRCVVNAMNDTLFAFHAGYKSSSSLVRKAIQRVDLDPFENELALRIGPLTRVLAQDHHPRQAETHIPVDTPLGTVKLKIIEMLIYLFAFQTSETVATLVAQRTPQVLFELFLKHSTNNMLHNLIAMCIEASLNGPNDSLKIVWLKDVNLISNVVDLWSKAQSATQANAVPYRGWILRVSRALHAFVERNSASSRPIDVAELVGTEVFSRFKQIETSEIQQRFELEAMALGGAPVPKRSVSILRDLAPKDTLTL